MGLIFLIFRGFYTNNRDKRNTNQIRKRIKITTMIRAVARRVAPASDGDQIGEA